MEEKRLKRRTCSRQDGKTEYCEFHSKACKNMVENYDLWKKALEISWKEYLSEIVKNQLSGEWAREVAKHLANQECK
jgi:hypothetical protein